MYAFAHPIPTHTHQNQPASSPLHRGSVLAHQQHNSHAKSVAQLQSLANNSSQVERTAQLQTMANNTGLPDRLKSGIEQLSGYSMNDVKVHYNSDKPAQLQAHAYAQGTEIHLASGQEKHLPHEAWHVVQQKQGRVQPTMQLKGKVAVNDDAGLEQEADVMGARAMNEVISSGPQNIPAKQALQSHQPVAQAYFIQHNIKISDNHDYRIDQAATHQLQVAPRAQGPNPPHLFHAVGNTPDGYTIYELNVAPAFQNDCLGFAEFLKTGKYDTKPAFRAKGDRPKGKDRLFGHSDSQNLDIAAEARITGNKRRSDFSQGSDAHPGIGEAYAIVRGEEEVDECPYHIAQVVAQDVDDNVTCEADAGDAARAIPVFDMYTTVKKKKKKGMGSSAVTAKGKTFHDTYESSYLTASKIPPVTGVLV